MFSSVLNSNQVIFSESQLQIYIEKGRNGVTIFPMNARKRSICS